MKYNHMVNHNGIYYQAGEEVPIEAGVEKASASSFESAEPKKRVGRPPKKATAEE